MEENIQETEQKEDEEKVQETEQEEEEEKVQETTQKETDENKSDEIISIAIEDAQKVEGVMKPKTKKERPSALVAFFVALIGAMIYIAAFFVPYMSATSDYSDMLETLGNVVLYDNSEISSDEVLDVSLFEYSKICFNGGDIKLDGEDVGGIYFALIAILGVCTILTAIFVLMKKPVSVFLFNIVSFGLANVINWDFKDREVISDYTYVWSTGYYLYYVAAAAVLCGVIWMFIEKIKSK